MASAAHVESMGAVSTTFQWHAAFRHPCYNGAQKRMDQPCGQTPLKIEQLCVNRSRTVCHTDQAKANNTIQSTAKKLPVPLAQLVHNSWRTGQWASLSGHVDDTQY